MIIFYFFSSYILLNFEHLTLNKKEKAICINLKLKIIYLFGVLYTWFEILYYVVRILGKFSESRLTTHSTRSKITSTIIIFQIQPTQGRRIGKHHRHDPLNVSSELRQLNFARRSRVRLRFQVSFAVPSSFSSSSRSGSTVEINVNCKVTSPCWNDSPRPLLRLSSPN